MTQTSGDASQLYHELWISFAALLRAYAAAASLAIPGGALEIKDRNDGGLELCTASKSMKILFNSQSGSGRFTTSSAEGSTTASGSFTLTESGTVNLDDPASGTPLEMDAAAEALIARIL